MMKNIPYVLLAFSILTACGGEEKKQEVKKATPVVRNNGQTLFFPDPETLAYFKTENISTADIHAAITAIGKVGATVMPSNSGALQNLVLFENPDLARNYTQLIQHQINIRQIQDINIKQRQVELERTKDLYLHGTATGQDLLNAQAALSMEETGLANERAALIEHEATLKSAGFNPELLRNAKTGTAYIICDVPENQISNLTEGGIGHISFSSFPNDPYTGKIENIADAIAAATRMVRVRINVNNSSNKLKAGMFATVSFDISKSNLITVDKTSLATVQGKNYVFVKTSATEFERREIQTGQQLGDRLIVFNGLSNGDEIAVEGVMQLKGLSFGY